MPLPPIDIPYLVEKGMKEGNVLKPLFGIGQATQIE